MITEKDSPWYLFSFFFFYKIKKEKCVTTNYLQLFKCICKMLLKIHSFIVISWFMLWTLESHFPPAYSDGLVEILMGSSIPLHNVIFFFFFAHCSLVFNHFSLSFLTKFGYKLFMLILEKSNSRKKPNNISRKELVNWKKKIIKPEWEE